VTKIPDINNLTEEVFILAHGFRGFSLRSLGPMHLGRTSRWQVQVVEESYSLQSGKEAEGEKRKGLVTSYPQGSGRPHLPKFPQFPKIAPAARDLGFNT
jgi:hypothetical protein